MALEQGLHRIALLQVDIVDSTRIGEQLGDTAMSRLWTHHDRLARDLLLRWNGQEIDKSDGFLLAFPEVSKAIGFATAYHEEIGRLDTPMKARAGLHAGEAYVRLNAPEDVVRGAKPCEIDGAVKPTTARLMVLASGGQTLVSDVARQSVAESDFRFRSHGHWRFKGISTPIEVFELGDAVAIYTPPGASPTAYRVERSGEFWAPVAEVKNSLPAERDRFIGRRADLSRVRRLIDDGVRLVTVLGIGGSGKTRLAQRFGRTWLGDFPGGVWFCDATPARESLELLQAVARGLDIPIGPGDAVAQLGHAIAGRGSCLLILDNLEQVVASGIATIGRWLEMAPMAVFICTSRERLGIGGEAVLRLEPMQATDASELFADRAKSVSGESFTSSTERDAIGRIVGLLDGLPLAVELAAARTQSMSLRAIADRMGDRFRLLGSTRQPGRQATLQAVMDWSWDLLSVGEKAALAQLSIFEGGMTLEAAEAVLDVAADSSAWVPDLLHTLLEKSLLRKGVAGRFELLSIVKDYASVRFREPNAFPGSGPDAVLAAHRRHERYFGGFDEDSGLECGVIELDNFVVACRRAIDRNESRAAAKALSPAWAILRLRGPFATGVDLAAAVRTLPGLNERERSVVGRIEGEALRSLGRVEEAMSRLSEALEMARAVGDRASEARVRSYLGMALAQRGENELASAEFRKTHAYAVEMTDLRLQCITLSNLGNHQHNSGNLTSAQAYYEELLGVATAANDRRWLGGAWGNLGLVYWDQGRLDLARRAYQSSLDIARELDDRQFLGNTLCNLGLLLQEQKDHGNAAEALEAALKIARELGHARLEATVSCNLGLLNQSTGADEEALKHLLEAQNVAAAIGDKRLEGQCLGYIGAFHVKRGDTHSALRCLDRGEELLLATSDVLSLGVLLCARAELEYTRGAKDTARELLARAQALATKAEASATSELGLRIGEISGAIGPL